MHCDDSHLNMQTIPVHCHQVCIKDIVHKKQRKAEPFILAAKKVYNKTTRASITSFPPTFYSNQGDLCFQNITSVDTGSD